MISSSKALNITILYYFPIKWCLNLVGQVILQDQFLSIGMI